MKRLVLILILITTGFSAFSQKIKYKDLYVLLRAKNYKDGAVFLQKFLVDNPEHPNANYQKGLMLQHKLAEYDILKEPDKVAQRADSAIMYFDKAITLINEKEIKKHDDDYYELFKRRNLRTGKFEVILSDVQLDIENRKNNLATKKQNAGVINKAFNRSIRLYSSVQKSYNNLKRTYQNELTLSLSASDSTISDINTLIVAYDSSVIYFKQYKKLNNEFDLDGEEVSIYFKSIDGFEEKELKVIDFYGRKVEFINFSEWGNEQLIQIEKQHQLLDNLIEFDKSLEMLRDQIFNDSVSVKSKIISKYTDPTLKALKELDKESDVYKLINYKLGELNLNSGLMSWYKDYSDTLDVGVQLIYVNELKNEIEGIKSLHSSINTLVDDQFWLKYSSFILNRYHSKELFVEFINAQNEVISSQETKIAEIDAIISVRDGIGYFKGDSIPLTKELGSASKYHTFYTDSLENRTVNVVGFIQSNPENYIYFGYAPSSRQLDTLFISETKFTLADVSSESFIVLKEHTLVSSALFLMGDIASKKLLLVHFSESSGILWEKPITLILDEQPELSYLEGHIIILDGEITRKFSLENGKVLE